MADSREVAEKSKYAEAQREREERKARLQAIMSRTRKTPTAVVAPTTQRSGGDEVCNVLSYFITCYALYLLLLFVHYLFRLFNLHLLDVGRRGK